MDVDELFTIFRNHKHTGTYPDAVNLPQLSRTTIILDDSKYFLILISPNGTRFRVGVDDDGALKTTRI